MAPEMRKGRCPGRARWEATARRQDALILTERETGHVGKAPDRPRSQMPGWPGAGDGVGWRPVAPGSEVERGRLCLPPSPTSPPPPVCSVVALSPGFTLC